MEENKTNLVTLQDLIEERYSIKTNIYLIQTNSVRDDLQMYHIKMMFKGQSYTLGTWTEFSSLDEMIRGLILVLDLISKESPIMKRGRDEATQ